MAIAEISSNSECFTSETMPRIVAMAPGPNMIGMARGTKETSSFSWVEPPEAPVVESAEDDGEKAKADAHEDDPADNTNHAQWNSKNPHYELAKEEKEKCQEHGVEARSAGNPAVFLFALTFEQLEENRQGLQRIDDSEKRREHPEKQRQFLRHDSFFWGVSGASGA